jgi:hypothetical protein
MSRRIAEIAEVRAGYPFRGRVVADPGGNARVVQIRDLDDDGQIRLGQLVTVKAANLENYRFRPRDVLFLARGERRFAIPLPDQTGDALIAASYFFVIRPGAEIDARYLVWVMNQPDFQEAMRVFVKGSSLPQITKTDLLDLPIDVPPLATQQRIVMAHRLMEKERRLMDQIWTKRSALLRAVARNESERMTARNRASE